jgi:hypothetical protein
VSFFRLQGDTSTPLGIALPGISVAILTQPANTSSTPGTPLAQLYSGTASNAATITGASWSGQQITFIFSTTPPADVVAGSYISVSGAAPSAFNGTWLVVEVNGADVIVTAVNNPGTYISGGVVATSTLPNPVFTDGNGYWFAYAAPGLYTVQVYDPSIATQVYPDQQNGTVAGGSVLSVGLIGDGVIFNSTISGSPVTTTGDFDLSSSILTQTANFIFAGPSSGSAAAPTFRALVLADLPGGIGAVTSVGVTLTVPAIFTSSVTGSPVTSTGTIAQTIALANEAANSMFAGPTSGGSSLPTFRALVIADIPASGYPTFGATVFQGGWQDKVQTASGSTDALTFPASVFITTAGVDATTLATPVAGGPGVGDDGKRVLVIDTSGHAHTITTAANKIVPSHSLVTFGGGVGASIQFEAFGGVWYPLFATGVSIS